MAKGFVIAITAALILVVVMLFAQNFSLSQNEEINRVSRSLVSEKVAHSWSDVRDDIYTATQLLVSKINNSALFIDSLPSLYDISDFLHLYGLFVDTYYETPDIDIKFLTPTGQQMDLGSIPSRLKILPFNIEYYYPSWAKRELFITAPAENISAITNITMHLNLTNAYMDCKPVNPSSSNNCDFVNPLSDCKDNTVYRLYLNLSFSDYRGQFFQMPNRCYDLGKHSTENLNVKNATSNYFLKVLIGSLPTVINVQMQNTALNATTAIILNTTDFYINYLSQLGVSAVNYNTSRYDWA